MRQNIEVQSFTEIKTAQSQRKYWTLQNTEQKIFVCFIIPLREYCHIGAVIDAEVEPSLKEGDSSRLVNIYVDGKPVYQDEKKFTGRTFGKSKEELAQVKELAEAQNRSIQAQTALNRAVDLAIGGLMPIPKESGSIDLSIVQSLIEDTAKEFYELLQSLTQEEVEDKRPRLAKEIQISKEVSVNETGQAPSTVIESAKDLMAWAKKHGKYPSWVRQTAKLGDQTITDAAAIKAYQELKEITGWED